MLRSFGKYSYGLYVYHMPLFIVFDYVRTVLLKMPSPIRTRYAILYVPITVGLTFGAAWLSYNLFEDKFLRLKGRFSPTYETPRLRQAEASVLL